MPTTRSASAVKPSSSQIDAPLSENGELHDDLEGHLSALQRGIRDLRKSQEDLLQQNQQLQREIDRLHNQTDVSVQPSPVKLGGKSNSLLQVKVKELELKVRRLTKARALDRKKIQHLRLKEAHKDAEELQDEELHGIPDVEHEMKKLLRDFYRVMTSPSLDEQEECPICADTMKLTKCSSLACQHVFCDSCLSKITDGGSLSCPQCRRDSNVESFEAVEFTATEQWDQLLEIAQQFAAMEGRLGPETSEEEEEENLRENFIDDDEVEASSESRDREITPDKVPEGESDEEEEEESERKQVPYSRSGVTEKRRRMEQLAARKRQRG